MADRVLVSVSCQFENNTPEVDALRSRAIEWKTMKSGALLMHFTPTGKVVSADSGERQRGFEEALLGQLAALARAGVSATSLRENNGAVLVNISLNPKSGQAGIVLSPDLLARATELNSTLLIDSFSGTA